MNINAFGKKLISAGIDTNGISWGSDGQLTFHPQVDAERIAAVTAIRDAWAEKDDLNAGIDADITRIEVASPGGVFVRGLREYLVANTAVWNRVSQVCSRGAAGEFATVQEFAAALAAAIPDFMANKGMQNVKALDDQIRALRAQRQ